SARSPARDTVAGPAGVGGAPGAGGWHEYRRGGRAPAYHPSHREDPPEERDDQASGPLQAGGGYVGPQGESDRASEVGAGANSPAPLRETAGPTQRCRTPGENWETSWRPCRLTVRIPDGPMALARSLRRERIDRARTRKGSYLRRKPKCKRSSRR